MALRAGHILVGLNGWIESWGFIFNNRLAIFFLYPLLLTVVIGMGLIAVIRQGLSSLLNSIFPDVRTGDHPGLSWDRWSEWAGTIMDHAANVVLWLFSVYLVIKISKYIVLIAMSPVMAVLSERVEEIITGRTYTSGFMSFMRDALRGSALAMRNLFIEIGLGIVLFGLDILFAFAFPPAAMVFTPLIPLISFLIGAYYFGFSTIDYVFERRGLSFRASISKMKEIRGIALGNGIVFALLFRIPVIGVSLSSITCTVGAVLALRNAGWMSLLNNEPPQHNP